ncbi:2-dehydropantoate 2-reductase [Pandoraea sputorum]|uniref:2-dehydropantoate 2-reductase n=1 Tax=Pandoraea sputorum TaxID=93222 RepID=UPI002AF6AA31|nr:2-dehydropantoate 2-reductase [Pandoraea sputorum]
MKMERCMRVLILGAGAIGGYYGARLMRAGTDVTFLARSKRADRLRREGLSVKSPLGDYQGQVRVLVSGSSDEVFDVVVLACKAYDLSGAIDAITPHVGTRTLIVPLLNGLKPYDQLDEKFGLARVAGGVAYIATMLNESGEIVHLNAADKLIIGARHADQRDAVISLYTAFSYGDGSRVMSDDIEQDLWEKWIMLAAGAAVTCLMQASIGEIVATRDGPGIVQQILGDCVATATAQGKAPRENVLASIKNLLLDPSSTWKASMRRDIERGVMQIEADAIVGDMLQRARAACLTSQLLSAAYCQLQTYEAHALKM